MRVIKKSELKKVKKLSCVNCAMFPTDPAHVKSVGSGGPDLPFNLIPLCRTCHVMQHKTGWVTLFKTNAKIGAALKNRGWYLINEKLFNDHFSDIHVLRMQKHTD